MSTIHSPKPTRAQARTRAIINAPTARVNASPIFLGLLLRQIAKKHPKPAQISLVTKN